MGASGHGPVQTAVLMDWRGSLPCSIVLLCGWLANWLQAHWERGLGAAEMSQDESGPPWRWGDGVQCWCFAASHTPAGPGFRAAELEALPADTTPEIQAERQRLRLEASDFNQQVRGSWGQGQRRGHLWAAGAGQGGLELLPFFQGSWLGLKVMEAGNLAGIFF